MDPTAPSITFFDKDTGKGRATYIGSLQPARMFPPTVGIWFTNQGDEVFKKLKAYYEEEPYPTQERMEELAEEFGAPDWTKIENFFKNMQLKHQEQFQ